MSSTYGWCWNCSRCKNPAAPWEWFGKGQPRETQTKSRGLDSQPQQRKYCTPFQSLLMKSTFAAFPAALLLGCWFWRTMKPFSIRGFSCPCPWRACWVMPVRVIKVVLHLLNRWERWHQVLLGGKCFFVFRKWPHVHFSKQYIHVWLKSTDLLEWLDGSGF